MREPTPSERQAASNVKGKMRASFCSLEFLQRLASEGGAIVSSAACDETEIAAARNEGRFFVDNENLGYVLRRNGDREGWAERLDQDAGDLSSRNLSPIEFAIEAIRLNLVMRHYKNEVVLMEAMSRLQKR